jgi:AmmeMemoRadiSam system protein B
MKYTIYSKLPKIRPDIALMKHVHGEDEYLLMYDPLRYSRAPMILALHALRLLDCLQKDEDQTCEIIAETAFEGQVDAESIRDVILQMSDRCFLLDDVYHDTKSVIDQTFLESNTRDPFCLGTVYPEHRDDAISLLDEIKQSASKRDRRELSGIIIPHVELSEGKDAYASALRALEASDAPDLVILFATSHYGGEGRFIFTEKDFLTPLGTTTTEKSLVKHIFNHAKYPLTKNDAQHRYDHSIEIVLLLLQYAYGAESFSLLPILVNGMHDRFSHAKSPSDEGIQEIIHIIKEYCATNNRSVLFVSSGDLSHIGRKFGDADEAQLLKPEIIIHDQAIMEALQAHDAQAFFTRIASTADHSRICGCSPNYMLLESLMSSNAELLSYQWWDQHDTASAVSFCSVAYFAESS